MNPFINLYRKFTPNRRTPDEKPFDKQDLEIISRSGFSGIKRKNFTLFCIIGIALNSVLKLPGSLSISYKPLKKVDELMLSIMPSLEKFCWNTVLMLTK